MLRKKYLVSHALSLSFFYALKIGCASTPLDCFKNERALFLSLQLRFFQESLVA